MPPPPQVELPEGSSALPGPLLAESCLMHRLDIEKLNSRILDSGAWKVGDRGGGGGGQRGMEGGGEEKGRWEGAEGA